MSYIIKKQSPEPSSRRIIISSPDARSLQSRKYVIKNRDSSLNSFRYVDNDYDGYISDGPVIVQKPTPRTVIVQQEPAQQKKYVYVEDEVDDYEDVEDNDEEVLYYIDGKYYKSKPQLQQSQPIQQNVVYMKNPQPQKENVVYYVDENDDDDEYEDVEEPPIIQKKIIINKRPKPIQQQPKIVYVNESPRQQMIESPRITYRPKPPSVVVKQTLKPLESQPQQKPLQKIILENRSKPRNNYRREIEKIEIRDKPLPNRNIIHGNTVVYK